MRNEILFFALLFFLSACGDFAAGGPSGPEAPSTAMVLTVEAPDTLYSGSQPLSFVATVEDSLSGIQNVVSVVVRLTRPDSVWSTSDLELQNTTATGEGQFSAVFDSTFAAGRLGDYTLEFQAVDRDNRLSNLRTKNIYLENEPPTLFNPVVSDTLQTGSLDFQVKISATDPQGPSDIEGVFFQNRKPDGSFGADGTYYPLADIGQSLVLSNVDVGDEVEGDGIYSWDCKQWNICPPASAALGTYSLVFTARDRAGNISATPSRDYELVTPQR
jgi:hypothetical protein